MANLKGRHAIVTGAGKGIGAAIARKLHLDGAECVAIFEMDAEQAARTAQSIDPTGERVLVFPCDVSSADQVALCVANMIDRCGTIDILVNNAAITRDAMFHKMSLEDWNMVLQVDLYGTFYICRQVLPCMRKQGYGRIVNIASTAAYGNPGQANYSAAKGAIISMSATLAKESGPKNVTVNCVAPGIIRTDLLRTIPSDVLDSYLAQIPLQRLGEPEDVANVVSFLVSDEASYLTGQCIGVNGGLR